MLITSNSQKQINNVDKNGFFTQTFTHSFCQGNKGFQKFSTESTRPITNTTNNIYKLKGEKNETCL